MLIDFLSENEISCHNNFRNLKLFKGIKGGELRHLSYKGQIHRVQ